MTARPVSDCCGVPVRTEGRTTQFYRCSFCEQPCGTRPAPEFPPLNPDPEGVERAFAGFSLVLATAEELETYSTARMIECDTCGARIVPRGFVPGKHEHTYRTKTGKVLTDADIQALADEAEAGYDIEPEPAFDVEAGLERLRKWMRGEGE